jgi:hypothetical protein
LLCEEEEGTGWRKGTADERARPVSDKREGRWKWAGAGMLGWNRKWAGGGEVGLRVRKRKREGKRVWGGFSFKLFFSSLFSFLKKSFCKLLKLPNSFQTKL